MKFVKFSAEIFIIQSATHNVSKKQSFSKIYPLERKVSSILCQKTCEIDQNPIEEKINVDFIGFHMFSGIKLKIPSVPVDGFC
jgi:hypothetical protein